MMFQNQSYLTRPHADHGKLLALQPCWLRPLSLYGLAFFLYLSRLVDAAQGPVPMWNGSTFEQGHNMLWPQHNRDIRAEGGAFWFHPFAAISKTSGLGHEQWYTSFVISILVCFCFNSCSKYYYCYID